MNTYPVLPLATRSIRSRKSATGIALLLAAALLAIAMVAVAPSPAGAQAAPVAQCNDDAASNVGGQGISCTVVIVNYVNSDGTIATTAPSTVTMTRCVGAAGPIGAGAGTCATTVTTSSAPVTLVQQCNGSANGGGGVLICSVSVTNHFNGTPTAPVGPATVYQCIGSVITGTGAPGTCTPVNTPGVTSVTAATVGQCNGSGNGGTSVGFTCTVDTASTVTTTLSVNVDQCNGSANGGGSLVTCTASVSNQVTPSTPTPTPTPAVTPTPTPSATSTPTPAATAEATGVATAVPTAPPGGPVPVPADTGNADGLAESGGLPVTALLLSLATVGLLVGARRLPSHAQHRPQPARE